MEKVVNINNLISISDELLEEYGYKKMDKHRFVHSNLDFIDIYKNRDGYYPYNFYEDIVIGRKIENLQHLENIIFDLKGVNLSQYKE